MSTSGPRTWFTSDTHFGHAKIVKYCDRPFADVDEMNRTIIERWNALVEPEDTVYHLGDFFLCKKEQAIAIRKALKGKITLVLGNHDRFSNGWYKSAGGMTAVVKEAFINKDENGLADVYLSHIPIAERKAPIHLCGHVHEKWKRRGDTINVGVDQWRFQPITLGDALLAPETPEALGS